jgi:hypothetical protein
MSRTKKGADKGLTSQGAKDAKASIRAAKKRARELLKKAGRDVKSVRHDVAELKKVGLVSKRVDVRSYLPSRYMLRKIEANRDVLAGKMIAVKAPKTVRERYTKKGIFEQRGSTLIVPREYSNQKTRITRGLVELSRELRMGEETRLILPFKAADMEGIARGLLADPSLNGMKRPDELFGFRLFGHNMNTIGFPDVEEFANYILTNYAHLFSGKNGREGVKHFELFRFKSRNSQMKESPEEGRKYTPRPPRKGGPKRDFVIRKRLERDAARKAKARERETPEQRKKRLEEQRRRQANLRQRKWEDD